MVVLFTTAMVVAMDPPKVTIAPLLNPAPLMVTLVPPLSEPAAGETDVTVTCAGEPAYLKPLSNLKLCPSLLVTITSAGPGFAAGVGGVVVDIET